MIIGVLKEIKESEYRVGMVPVGAETLVRRKHKVLIQKSAGQGSGISDEEYARAGAEIVDNPEEIYRKSEMIVKVKEPLPEEYKLVREGQIIFTYFHFAANRELTYAMLEKKIIAIAYETIQTEDGNIPLLVPMSEVAGRMSIQEGAKYLEKPMHGKGILLGGVPGVAPANVLILGGGIVGTNAAKVAAGLGARVDILDTNLNRLRYLDDIMPKNVITLMSNSYNIRKKLADTDLLIGAVLVRGAQAPKLITGEMIRLMKPGSVAVDVAIDQGGCFETSKPTTHSNPVYVVDGVVHYCVTNMPGAVAGTSTYALTNATLRYVVEIADKGYEKAIKNNPAVAKGLNMVNGKITIDGVSDAFGMKCCSLKEAGF